MTRCLFLRQSAIAYSATTVLPADVCAATKTDSLRCMEEIDTRWKGSNVKGYDLAGSFGGTCWEIGTYG
jgi:hypothetical protein